MGQTIDEVLEIIEKYKLRIPPTTYYELKADIVNYSENPTGSTTKNDLGVDCIDKSTECKHKCIDNDLGVDKLLADCEKMSFEIEIFNKPLRVVALDAVKNIVKDLPSVTPQEPKTGRWIANAPQYDMLNPQYICSECGNAHTRTTPYCEMCGAKMVEPESEAEDGECI